MLMVDLLNDDIDKVIEIIIYMFKTRLLIENNCFESIHNHESKTLLCRLEHALSQLDNAINSICYFDLK